MAKSSFYSGTSTPPGQSTPSQSSFYNITSPSGAAAEAAASAAAAAAVYDSFDDRYLGSKAANPTVDNDGAALLTGALYWNNVSNEMRAWSGSAWIAIGGGGGAVSSVFTRTGAVTAATDDYAVAQVTGAAPLASPTFTGTPAAPTPSAADSTTKIATTAFVQGELTAKANIASPALTGVPTAPTATGGVSNTQIATTAFVQGEITGKADLASPTFTGNPIAPTPSPGDNDTSIATTAFVVDALSGASAGFRTGWVQLTFETTAPATWILLNDGSIGNGSSSATTRANADTSALFVLLYNNITALVLQDSSGSTVARGANAAADFAANRRLVIPKALGRSIAIAGAGSGLTPRTLGSTAGSETETPTIAKTATHGHLGMLPQDWNSVSGSNASHPLIGTGTSTAGTQTGSVGSSSVLNILDPSTYMNALVKL